MLSVSVAPTHVNSGVRTSAQFHRPESVRGFARMAESGSPVCWIEASDYSGDGSANVSVFMSIDQLRQLRDELSDQLDGLDGCERGN